MQLELSPIRKEPDWKRVRTSQRTEHQAKWTGARHRAGGRARRFVSAPPDLDGSMTVHKLVGDERLAEYGWKPHRDLLAQKSLSRASIYRHMRYK